MQTQPQLTHFEKMRHHWRRDVGWQRRRRASVFSRARVPLTGYLGMGLGFCEAVNRIVQELGISVASDHIPSIIELATAVDGGQLSGLSSPSTVCGMDSRYDEGNCKKMTKFHDKGFEKVRDFEGENEKETLTENYDIIYLVLKHANPAACHRCNYLHISDGFRFFTSALPLGWSRRGT
jgi:hypothetical protein